MNNCEEALLQRESFLMQELKRLRDRQHRDEARLKLGLTLEGGYSVSELRELKLQLQHELNEVRAQFLRNEQEPLRQADPSAVETTVRVGASGLIGYALGRAIHSGN